jgi:hypothetical protein
MVASERGLVIDAPGTRLTSSGPTTPTFSPTDGGRTATRFALTVVVVFGALPHPAPVPAQSTASAMRAALIRISPN